MLKMIKGSHVPKPQMLSQGFEITDSRIIANVDADNIRKIIEGFLDMNKALPLFMFIEVPANIKDEKIIGKTEDGYVQLEAHHKDVYYLDGISSESLKQLLEPFYDILINDGLSSFGVGNPYGEEVGKYKYNEMILFGKELQRYAPLLEQNGVFQTNRLITAWDTFTPDSPGTCEKYSDEKGRDIYGIIDALKEFGMYRAEQRED